MEDNDDVEVDDDVDDDDLDFNPLLSKGSPSETSSSLTSEAECEETRFGNQPSTEVYLRENPGNKYTGGSVLPQKGIPTKSVRDENVPESNSTQLYHENGEGHVNGLGKEPLQTSFSPSVLNFHPLLVEASKEDAMSKRTWARCSQVEYALQELETFLLESDNEGELHNVDEEQEYRKFLAAVLSGADDETQACQGGETHDEDGNDADFTHENINGKNEKDAHRPCNTKKRPKLSREVNRHESTAYSLRPILPNSSSAPLAPQNASHHINVPSVSSSVSGAAVVEGFTHEQLGQLHMMIYEHVQLMIQTFSLSVLDPSKQQVAADVKKMIVELVGYRDQALARRTTICRQFCFERQHLQSVRSHASSETSQCQWIPLIRNPVMSILDVSPLHLALSYLSDVAAAIVKHRKSLVDGTAEKIRYRKDPLFPSPVLSTDKDANNVSQDRSNNVSTASPGQLHPKKTLAATHFEKTKKEAVALVPFNIARLAQRFFPLFNQSLFPHKPPPAATAHRIVFTDAEERLLALGILEHNCDWDAIQKRFLPAKSMHQIYVRQKNRCSSTAPDNPIKEVRRMKTSPLSTEEIQCIEEGLKKFKNDWTSVWKFLLPHRDPAQLQRQWRVATGGKSDILKEKRSHKVKRRKLKASMPARGQEADSDAFDGVENDDDAENGSHVVKLAPDLPAVNLPPSARVMSQKEFNQSAAHYKCTSDNAANDLFPMPPPTFTECVYTQLNIIPDRSTSDRLQHGNLNASVLEDGPEEEFPMHPLLFQYPRQVLSSYSHAGENLTCLQFEKNNKQTTDGMEGAPVNAYTIDCHPLLQRTEAEMHREVPDGDCHLFANQSVCCMREPPVNDQSTARKAFTNPCERQNSIDLQASTSPCVRENYINRASISNQEPRNACSHHDIEGPSEEALQGIVMEHEELSDSEEDSQHVEFECEEIDDSEEEKVKDGEPFSAENKGTSTSVGCSEFQESSDQCENQQVLEQVVKQGASLARKPRGSSSASSGRANLKLQRTGTRRSQRLATCRTSEPSQDKIRRASR